MKISLRRGKLAETTSAISKLNRGTQHLFKRKDLSRKRLRKLPCLSNQQPVLAAGMRAVDAALVTVNLRCSRLT